MELAEFGISIKDEYPLLNDKAQRILIPFSSSYLCETGFSAVSERKIKYKAKGKGNEGGRVQINSTM